jgi:Ca2+-transporting ATPase
MDEKPRNPKEGLFARGGAFTLVLYGTIIGLITLLAFLYHPITEVGFDLEAIVKALDTNKELLVKSETCAFLVLGLSQLFHMLGMSNTDKSFVQVFKSKNWLFLLSFVVGFGLMVLMTEVEAIGNIFGVAQMDAIHWVILVLISMIPLVIHEIIVLIKWWCRRTKTSKFYKVFTLSAIAAFIVLIAIAITLVCVL